MLLLFMLFFFFFFFLLLPILSSCCFSCCCCDHSHTNSPTPNQADGRAGAHIALGKLLMSKSSEMAEARKALEAGVQAYLADPMCDSSNPQTEHQILTNHLEVDGMRSI